MHFILQEIVEKAISHSFNGSPGQGDNFVKKGEILNLHVFRKESVSKHTPPSGARVEIKISQKEIKSLPVC